MTYQCSKHVKNKKFKYVKNIYQVPYPKGFFSCLQDQHQRIQRKKGGEDSRNLNQKISLFSQELVQPCSPVACSLHVQRLNTTIACPAHFHHFSTDSTRLAVLHGHCMPSAHSQFLQAHSQFLQDIHSFCKDSARLAVLHGHCMPSAHSQFLQVHSQFLQGQCTPSGFARPLHAPRTFNVSAGIVHTQRFVLLAHARCTLGCFVPPLAILCPIYLEFWGVPLFQFEFDFILCILSLFLSINFLCLVIKNMN